jgi:hypothetical protein
MRPSKTVEGDALDNAKMEVSMKNPAPCLLARKWPTAFFMLCYI